MSDREVIPREKFEQMLEEVAGYSVELEIDPTLPHLGTKYLQNVLAKCRNYTNRTLFYLQAVLRGEKDLKREIKQCELDLEFKMHEKLADDSLVRAQPSIADRQAVAASFLKVEYENLGNLRVELVDVQETAKILRTRYNDLQRTANDIKLQRMMVKDDKDTQLAGGSGYSTPQTNQDGSVQGGLVAPVNTKPVDPKDILNPDTRPVDMPIPNNPEEAGRIAAFLTRHPERSNGGHPGRKYTGKHCSVCKKPQYETDNGDTCELGHGGAPSVEEDAQPLQPLSTAPDPFEADAKVDTGINYSDLLD
jgi:hypothetical protein